MIVFEKNTVYSWGGVHDVSKVVEVVRSKVAGTAGVHQQLYS